ncbi:MAG: hypothetical protein LBM69_06215 [Lachnospiraceae bacterium]|nr:hypothetical protein [Lachnospiraceae bacterium]
MDGRKPLAEGTQIILGSKPYTIRSLVGFGGTSFVYSACYPDGIQPNKTHHVLLKELFPYQPEGLIYREQDGSIVVKQEAAQYFELCKKSFYRGNHTHIDLQNIRADMANVNIDSFEAKGSFYTVIGNLNGKTLQTIVGEAKTAPSLSAAVSWTLSLLDALDIFHKQGLLHLDISPDNILLLPLEKGKSEKLRKILLIDYNSVWHMNEVTEVSELYFSIKEHYSAPEVRMNQRREISMSTDLFSVCVVFAELISGKPLDFSLLYTGGRILSADAALLQDVPTAVSSKVLSIVKRGVKLPPRRRYQSISELRAELTELADLIYGQDIFEKLSKLHNKRTIPIIAISVTLALVLTFTTLHVRNQSHDYPQSAQEINATQNAMNALCSTIMKLGIQIQNDLDTLNAYQGNYADYKQKRTDPKTLTDTLIGTETYTIDDLKAYQTNGSPIRFDLLQELLNASNDYRTWSDKMHQQLVTVLHEESPYPREDRTFIVDLYKEYLQSQINIYYAKIQLIVLPLNDTGKYDFLKELPYVAVFGEKFTNQAFIKEETELEAIIEAQYQHTLDTIAQLKAYGMDV